ncbi:MAG TPA: HD domain-containing protein [Thermoguttaceae bacterium]|nr:HD domain-containing protein [Thermoguttaceae bacterium]
MSRRFVSQIGPQESIDQIFLVSDKQLRPNRSGNLYLQLELSDRTGSVGARMWNANEKINGSFENGDYARVEGSTQLFQGAIQMIVTRISRVESSEVNEDEFQPLTRTEVDRLVLRLGEMLRGMNDLALRNLAECFLMDDPFMAKFSRAPAGVKNHHAYIGGLLEHTVKLMEVVGRLAPCYPELDRDLLLTGAFLHDVGKIDELSYDHGFSYSDEGQLVGHLVMAVRLLDDKVAEAERLAGEPFPRETVLRLKHMLVSHHGEYEFGSPKLPMTLEAVALAFLDNLDAKLASFSQQLRDDPNVDSHWTAYNANLRRKLFKGTHAGDGAVVEAGDEK